MSVAYSRERVLSVSSIAQFGGCPLSFYLRYVEALRPLFVSSEARRGTQVHELCADHARDILAGRERWQGRVDRLLQGVTEEEQPHLREIIDAVEARYGKPPKLFPEYAENALVERSFQFRQNGSAVRRHDSRTQVCVGSTIDLLYFVNDGATAILRDYKTGRNVQFGELLEQDRQMRLYAYAVAQFFPNVTEIVIEKDHVRFGYGLNRAAFPREEFTGVWRELVGWVRPIFAALRRVEQGEDPHNVFPGRPEDSFCSWCSVRAHCPEFSRLPALPETISSLSDRRAMTDLALQIRRVKQSMKKAEAAVQRFVEEEGPIETGDEILELTPTTKRQVDLVIAVQTLKRHGFTKQEIFNSMSMPLTALDKLTAGKTQERKNLRRDMYQSGAVWKQPASTLKWGKKK